jgi:hypothetical protein
VINSFRGPRVSAVRIWAGLTAALASASFVMAFLTPPRSGPGCALEACVRYPYTDIAAYFPRDYYWMVPATLVLFTFLALVTHLHHQARASSQTATLIGLILVAISTATISLDYFIQLTAVQPSVLQGEAAVLTFVSQYNPHGLFIALEAYGYMLLCVGMAVLTAGLDGGRWARRVARWSFRAAGVLAVGTLLLFAIAYGHRTEYRYEIAVISVAWAALLVGCVALLMADGRSEEPDPAPR